VDTQFTAGAQDAQGNLAAVGDNDFVQHHSITNRG
jgi:hypothetical protein